MKKLLLSLSVAVFAAVNVQAQSCSPSTNPNYADSTFGAWPDTIQNFPPATENQFYSTNLDFKVPIDATQASSVAPPGSTIQSFTVTGVEGLPTGYDYVCNISSCSYDGGDAGCANVFGTTAETGTFAIIIRINADVLVTLLPGFPPTVINQDVEFTGYKIVVGTAGQIEQLIAPLKVIPNPAKNVITIEGLTNSMKATSVSITNIEGRTVSAKSLVGNANTTFDVSNLNSGIYFVNVYHASGVEKVKFVKE